jgi:hypothetical protein
MNVSCQLCMLSIVSMLALSLLAGCTVIGVREPLSPATGHTATHEVSSEPRGPEILFFHDEALWASSPRSRRPAG